MSGSGSRILTGHDSVDLTPHDYSERNQLLDNVLCRITGSGVANALFLLNDNAPDFVQDRGHTYGAQLLGADKRALIDYMRTFRCPIAR